MHDPSGARRNRCAVRF
ncbi:hypothetical protein DevBK_19795 [Devosia sp. BK]|nr:hypothetical protein [Devosia sp. BK]